MIAIESLHHIGITVTDLARAKAFYGGVLGLRELPRPPFDFGRRRSWLSCRDVDVRSRSPKPDNGAAKGMACPDRSKSNDPATTSVHSQGRPAGQPEVPASSLVRKA